MMDSHPIMTKASIDDLPPLLFDHLVARIVDLDPRSAIKLQLLSTKFFDSTSKALYEELSFPDDVRSLSRPSSRSRLEAVVRYPNKYSKFVRAITIIEKPKILLGGDEEDEDGKDPSSINSYFTFQPKIKIKVIGSDQLLDFLGRLESLEAFIWSSDRIMPSDLLSSLSTVTPALSILSIRPKINNEGQSQSPISTHTASFSSNHASNSPIYSIPMGSIGTPSSSPLEIQSLQPSTIKEEVEGQPHSSLNVRSDLIGIHSFPCLRELYLSNLSMEGARNLTMALPYLPHLEHVTLDFTFVEDSLLCNLKEACMNLKTLRIRTTGTKTTDKSILTLLESNSLQSLDLSSVEGRLTKKLWSKISLLSDEFTTLKISFEEKGHHHTWVTDHLNSLFEIFPATTNGLRVLSVTRIYPLDEKVNNGNGRIGNAGGVGNGNGINSLGLGIGISQPLSNYPEPSVGSIQNQNQIQSPSTLGLYSPGSNQNSGDSTLPPCNEVVSPRPFPKDGLVALGEYGRSLVTLELDFWTVSSDELKTILEACPHVEELKVLVDSTLGKIVSVASTTSHRLSALQLLTVSITENNIERTVSCLAPTTSQVLLPGGGTIHKLTQGDDNQRAVHRRNRSTSVQSSTSSIPDLSPSTSTVSHMDYDEAVTPAGSPIQERKTISARRLRKKSVGDEASSILGSTLPTLGNDSSMITKREVKKLAKRCPSLKILRWIGRGGKGEWHIASGGSQIEFFPTGSIPIGNGAINDPHAFDASLARRKTSSTASLREKLPISVNALLEGVENPAPFLEGGLLNPGIKSGSRGKGKTSEKTKSKGKGQSQSDRLEMEEQVGIHRETSTTSGHQLSGSTVTSPSISPQSSPQLGRREAQAIDIPKQTSGRSQNRKSSFNNQDNFDSSSPPIERSDKRGARDESWKGKNYKKRDDIERFKVRGIQDREVQEKSNSNYARRGGNNSTSTAGSTYDLASGKSSSNKDRKGSYTSSPTNPPEVSSSGLTASKPISIPGSGSASTSTETRDQPEVRRIIPGAPPEYLQRSASGSGKSVSPPVPLSRSISRSPDDEKDLAESSEKSGFGKRKEVEARSWSLANAAGTSHINARGRKTKPLSKMTSKGGAAVGANSGGGKKH